MENQDIIYNQIRDAVQKSENQGFDAMDKIWNRIEDKLDNKVLKKQTNNWKKMAVAASILLIVSLGYQFLKPKNENLIPQNQIVTVDTLEMVLKKVIAEKGKIAVENPIIIKKDIKFEVNGAVATIEPSMISAELDDNLKKDIQIPEKEIVANKPSERKSKKEYSNFGKFLRRKMNQNVENHSGYGSYSVVQDSVKTKLANAKIDPIVVIDGSANLKKMSDIDEEEVESKVFLEEPLYIINGVYYTEQQMFGPNPTSPYAPLDKQDLISIEILQDKEAVEKYGEKGKKGVVIIKTKYGSPVRQ